MPRVMSRKQYLFVLFLALALIVVTPAFAQADLSRLVVVGDSLSAGFQNGSLLSTQQVNGYANVVAKQAGAPLTLPLMQYPGVPQVLQLKSVNPLVIEPAPDPIGAMPRLNPTEQATNLAVPGATVNDALTRTPCSLLNTPPDCALTTLILGLPGELLPEPLVLTQVQWAQALHPTTIILWIGNNDALSAATSGNSEVTPLADFTASYTSVVNNLAATGAKLVIANIPDVTSIPFLVPVPKLETQLGLPPGALMAIGLQPGDFVTMDHVGDVVAILQGQAAPPLADEAVLTAAEAAVVSQAVNDYNAVIASEAQSVGAALVDINGLFKQIVAHGLVVKGQRITADFLGGVFSLDGIHPTNTGYAVIANEFIKTINRTYGNNIPASAVVQVAKTDPLILPGVGHPPRPLKAGVLDPMRKVLRH